jgi:hypothetical protein
MWFSAMCQMEFPDPDDIMNFNVTLMPDEAPTLSSPPRRFAQTQARQLPRQLRLAPLHPLLLRVTTPCADAAGVLEGRQVHVHLYDPERLPALAAQDTLLDQGARPH